MKGSNTAHSIRQRLLNYAQAHSGQRVTLRAEPDGDMDIAATRKWILGYGDTGAGEGKCSGPGKFRFSVGWELKVARLWFPRINDGDMGLVELAAVAGYDRHPMVGGAGSDDKVGLRKGVPGLPALFD